MAQFNRLVKIYDRNGKLQDVPQADVVSLQVTDLLNGGSGTGEIVFARQYDQIGKLGYGYTVLVWFWKAGTAMPVDPYYGGHVVDFDQQENDAGGRVTAHLEGDMKLLDAAIVSEKIAPGVSGNGGLDAALYLGHLLGTYQPTSFGTPVLPGAMFQLAPNQFDATKLGAAVDTITKQGMYPTPPDTTGVLFTWFVRTKADLSRRVVVQPDQNPNKAVIAATGARFKHLFRGSQIREYKIQNTYRDIVNVVAVYGSQDPQLGTPVLGVYKDQTSIDQFGPLQEKLSVPALQSVAACQAYATTYFALHAYPQAQSTFKVLDADPTILAGTWLQIDETPGDGGANAAVVKQIRVAQVTVRIQNDRVEQEVQTVSPTPYLDAAVYRMGLNVQAQAVTAIKGLAINRQTLFVRSGGYVTATANSPARVALAPTDAVFPNISGGAQLVSAPAFPLSALVDNTGSATNGQTGDGNYTISLTSAGGYVITRGTPPASVATQQNLTGAVVVSGVPFITDLRTLHALPLMPASAQSAGPHAVSLQGPTYPHGIGKSTFDALVSATLTGEAAKSSPWLLKLELFACQHGLPFQTSDGKMNATLIDRVDPVAADGNGNAQYAFMFGQLGAGTQWDLYARYSDGVLSSAPLSLGPPTDLNPLVVGVGNVNFGSHPAPAVTGVLASGFSQTTVHAQVDVTGINLTNVPVDGSVSGLAFYYRLHPNGTIKPVAEIQLAQNQASQSPPTFGFEVGAGQTIDVFVGYVGIASGDYGPLSPIGTTAQIQSGFMPFPIVVTGPYLAGTTQVPAVSPAATLTPRAAIDGVSSTIHANVAITNQPTDGSLGKIVWWYRKYTDAVWSFAGRIAPDGAPNPSASHTYDYDFVDLTNGQVYEFGVSFESVNQAEGAVLSLGTATALPVAIGSSKLTKMPDSVRTGGPTLATSPSWSSTIQHLGGSGVDLVTFTFSFTETNIAEWCSAVVIVMKDVVYGRNVGLPNYLAPIASNTGYQGAIAVPAGLTVTIGFCYLDQSGAASATTWAATSVVGTSIGTTYLASGNSVTSSPQFVADPNGLFTQINSANGISGGMRIRFTITNQPTDGSFYEVTLERRVMNSASTAYEKYVDLPGSSLGSSSGPYDFTALDLTNGQTYSWQIKFRSVQGQTSQPTVLGTSPSATVNVPTAALPSIPAGTTVSAAGFSLPASSYTGVGGANFNVQPTFAITITPPANDNRPFSQWGSGLAYWAKVNNGANDGDTNPLHYFSVGTYSGSTLPTTDTLGPLGTGNAYQLAVQPLDQQNIGGPLAVLGMTAVQTQGTPSFTGMPPSIKSNGPTITSATILPRATGKTGLIRSASLTFTEADFTAKPGWLDGIMLTVRINGEPDGAQQVRIDPSVSSSGTYTKVVNTTPGDTIDVGIAYVDTTGSQSAIVWPPGLSAQSDPDGGFTDPGDGGKGIVHNRMSLTTRAVVGLDGTAPFATKGQNLVANGDLSLYTPPTGIQSTYAHTVRTNDPGSLTPSGWTRNFVGGSEGSLNQYVVPAGQSVPAGPSLVLNDKPAGGGTFAAISDAFPVKPGAQYVFLADVFAGYNTGPLPANASWYMRVWFYKPGTTDFSRYSPTVAAGNIAYTADDGTTGTSATGYFDVIVGSTSTVGRTYRGVATVPSDAALCRMSVKHDGTATVPWNLLVQNVRCYEGNIDHATMSPGVQSAVASSGNLLASDFPGQTVHQTTGAYAGWELVTGSLLGGTGCKDVHGAPVSGTMLWSEWTAILPSPTVSYGPVFVDADGTGLLGILAVGGTGNVYASQGASKTIGIPANVAANSANNGLAHTFRMGIAYVSGANPSATWHLIGYIDGAKVFDQNVVANFNNTQAYAGFASGAGTPMYVRDFKWSVGNDSLEKAPVQVTTTIGAAPDTNGSYLNSNQISGRHLRGGSPTATGDLLDINDAGGSGTNFRHARMSRTLTYANRRVISVVGKMPYVSGGVLYIPSMIQVMRSADVVNIAASTTLATAAASYIFVNMTNGVLSSVTYTAAAANLDDPNYECIGYVDGNSWTFSPLGWANGDHLSAMQDVIGAVGGGVGDFHVGKARTGTLLPLTNHAQTIQNRNGIGAVVAGQMPYVDASNVLHFPSTVIMYRPDGSFCRVAAGTTVSLVAASGFAGVFLTWASAGNGAVIAINNGVAGGPGTGYAATMQSTSYELLGTSSGDSSPASFSPAFDNANTAAASYDVIGDNRDGSGNFHAGKARGGTLLPLPNHAQTIQNRNGLGAVVSGQMPYVDGSNVLHFPSVVLMFRPDGSFCRVAAGTTVSVGGAAAYGGVFLTWTPSGNGAVIALGYSVGGAAGTGYVATLQSTSYELLGTTTADSSPVTFSPTFGNANTSAAAYDVIGDNRDGSGNFHAGKARGGTLLPLPSHDPDVQKMQQRNLLKNGNFTLGPGLSYGWTMYSGGVTTGLAGGYASYTSQFFQGPSGSGIYQTIAVKPGATYSYAVMLYNDGSVAGSSSRVFISSSFSIPELNSSAPAPGGTTGPMWTLASNGRYSSESQAATSAWYSVSGTITIPANMYQVYFLLQGFGSSSYRVYANFAAFWEGSKWQDYVDGDPLPGALHYSHTPDAIAGVINSYGYITKSTALNEQFSIANIPDNVFTYSVSMPSGGGGTVTWSWPAFNIFMPDGSTVTVAAGSQAFTGAAPSSTYYYNAYATKNAGVATAAATVVGSDNGAAPSRTQQASYNRDGKCVLFLGQGVPTPAAPPSGQPPSGGTGNPKGGSCPSVDQRVLTQERGFIPAREIEPGMHLFNSLRDAWVEVIHAHEQAGWILNVTLGDETFEVDAYHVWLRHGGDPKPHSSDWIAVHELTLNTLIEGLHGEPVPVKSIGPVRAGRYVNIEVEGNVFALGRTVAHNVITL